MNLPMAAMRSFEAYAKVGPVKIHCGITAGQRLNGSAAAQFYTSVIDKVKVPRGEWPGG